ncbi:Apoptotic chromatin condensation inducer in the nucleus [Saguinus oedipus]|uniref:Apoptotic chromatin condensation inducer in the nucleus n=1 Tax=Saguinus oedipus TaxID=9490 RepID=A0ABQ9V4J7_SAGOE|nr:Apoptotic chromatin condensation inducer in the nucleus [Saguinus oedipus]
MWRRKYPSTSGGTRGYGSGRGHLGTFEGRWRKLPKMPEAVGTDPSTSRKMAELEEVTLDGKPLQALRVTDLKAALEQRGLAKSGQKRVGVAGVSEKSGPGRDESLSRRRRTRSGRQREPLDPRARWLVRFALEWRSRRFPP